MWWNKKRLSRDLENLRKEKREKDYLELNKKFQDKHQIVANWYSRKYLFGNNNGMRPINEEGFSYQQRVQDFFGYNNYGKLPRSFNSFAGVNYTHDENFDYFPIEKLLELYNKIEELFPEPFIDIKRDKNKKKF